MIVGNELYMIDSSVLSTEDIQMYCILSLNGNAAFIDNNTLFEEFVWSDNEAFIQWYESDDNKNILIKVLSQLLERKKQGHLSAFFSEHPFVKLLFIIQNLNSTWDFMTSEFENYFDELYKKINKELILSIQSFNVDEMSLFVQELEQQSRTLKNQSYVQAFLEGIDLSEECLSKISAIKNKIVKNIPIFDYIEYANRLSELDSSHIIYVTEHSAPLLQTGIQLRNDSLHRIIDLPILKTVSNADRCANFLKSLLCVCHYILNKVVIVDSLNEYDKNLFVLIWRLFQNENSRWIVSNYTFNKYYGIFSGMPQDVKKV